MGGKKSESLFLISYSEKVPEGGSIGQNLLEGSIMESARRFRKIPEGSGRFQKVPEDASGCRKVL
jgi:hypothetical protein